ncbi:MAG: GatB/YqeY domain-containing protein [Candidatus Omnitrophica bacterium]|nr:GatB/YqeY domain-containing protein [Candidatus Omnitrophota bacterium]
MKARDAIRVSALRMLRAALKNRAIEKRVDSLPDEEVIPVVQKIVKQHHDSIDSFKKGRREDLVKKEEAELAVISQYLPKQLTQEEITTLVKGIIRKTNAQGPQAKGLVMKNAMQELKGRADGSLVGAIVSAELAAGIKNT